ncbi:MAG: biotin--[acetyl-CoA-carboxylase] ligase [Chloroflexi bacterium]|nr:biotin--[acetyl-CoA-carboxylase] ligase [Chloroflexota bacterium]
MSGFEMTLSHSILAQKLACPFKYFERVESTNDVAKAWLAAGAPAGAVVIANEQTRGRGRHGRSWQTPPNEALALSLILKPEAAQLPRLNMLAALSVYDLAEEVGCEGVGIKWPNDVQIEGKKVCGLLPEALWQADRLIGAVLGIGVNVRADFDFTPLSERAISLEDGAGRRLDRAELIAALIFKIERWYRQIAAPGLFANWKSRLTTLNQAVAIGNISGVAIDVLSDGSLLICDESGRIHRTDGGMLQLLAADGA